MPKGVSSQPVFKPHRQHQTALLSSYDGGASRCHPRMLSKVMLSAYLDGVRSSRRIAKALRENVHYMSLSGSWLPDFRTLNCFRISHLKQTIEEVSVSLTALLVEAG